MENKDILEMYHDNLHRERLSLGKIASLTAFVISPIFYIKDVYMTEYIYSTFVWRLLPMIAATVFLLLRASKFKTNAKVIRVGYLGLVYSILGMMFGVFYQNYGTQDGRFNSFLIAGMITTLLMIQIFSAPIRKNINSFSISVVIFFTFTFTIKGGDSFIISNMINPAAIIIMIAIFSRINEDKDFSDFKNKVLLELSERDLRNEIEYRRELEKELNQEVLLDSLTGIYNKRASEKLLN